MKKSDEVKLLHNVLKQEQDSFLMVNKKLISYLGLREAVVLSDLISKEAYFYTENKITGDGEFDYIISDRVKNTGVSAELQTKIVKKLKISN